MVLPVALLMLALFIAFSSLILELNIHTFTNPQEVDSWLAAVNECNTKKKILTPKSPKVLYNGVYDATFLGAFITGLIIGKLIIDYII